MKVAIDAVAASRSDKGVARALRSTIAAFFRQHPDDYVVLARRPSERTFPGVPLAQVVEVAAMPNVAWEQFGLAWYARRSAVDLIYTMQESTPRWGPPCVPHIHEDPTARWARGSSDLKTRAQRAYARRTFPASLRGARMIVTSTEATAHALRSSWGRVNRYQTVHLAPDEIFRRVSGWAGAAPPTVRLDGLGPDSPFVFHLGSTDPRDNTMAVLQAHQALREMDGADCPLLVVAGSVGLDAQTAPRRHALVLGRVSDTELAWLYANALICIQPATDEGFGLQPLEAAASGTPVIALRTPAVVEVLGEGGCAFVIEAGPAALADEIDRLLTHPEERERLSRTALSRADHFTWDETARQLHALFTRLTS